MTELANKNTCDNVRLNKHGSKSKWFRAKNKARKEREFEKKVSLRQTKTNLVAEQCDAVEVLNKVHKEIKDEEEKDRLYLRMLIDMLE